MGDRDAVVAAPPGLLHALAYPAYAMIAGSTLVSNIGVWMRDTTSAWTVAGDAAHHSSVALVQAATAIPTFLLALPAGVLADHYDRRLILIASQVVLAVVGATLALLSVTGSLSITGIIGLAFAGGCAAAIAAPAFQSIVPSLVPARDLRGAVALSSVSFNIARVVGPGLGALMLAFGGAATAYACNATAYLVTIGALLAIGRGAEAAASATGRFSFRDELHQGLVFAVNSSGFRRILVRAAALYLSASCYLALTPSFSHDVLGSSPEIYGILLSATGIGSLIGAVVLSAAKKHGIADDGLLLACSACGAVSLAILSLTRDPAVASAAFALVGGATLIQLATFNSAAQILLPNAVRGRGLSIYMAVTFGAMAVGSLFWGAIATAFSISAALCVGAASFVCAALLGRSLPLDEVHAAHEALGAAA